MRLTSLLRVSVSAVQLGKKGPKADNILVKCYSLASGYRLDKIRRRLDDKLEFEAWDPTVQQDVLYREEKKLKSVAMPRHGIMQYPAMMGEGQGRIPKEEIWHRLYDDDKEAMARVELVKEERERMQKLWGRDKVKKKPRGKKV